LCGRRGGNSGGGGYAVEIPQACVGIVTAFVDQSGDPLALVVTGNGGQVGAIGAHTKSGKSNDFCQGEGPSRGLASFVSVLDFKRIEIFGIEFCIPIEPNGCPDPGLTEIDDCAGDGGIDPLPLNADFVIGDPTEADPDLGGTAVLQINQGTGADPNCALSQVSHNPCTWITIGGRAYGPICF